MKAPIVIEKELPKIVSINLMVPAHRRKAVFAEDSVECLAQWLMDDHKVPQMEMAQAMVQWLMQERAFQRFPDLIETLNAELSKNAE